MQQRPAVAYIRVSRPRQSRSGLGLEAQQAAIAAFAKTHGYRIADTSAKWRPERVRMRSSAMMRLLDRFGL